MVKKRKHYLWLVPLILIVLLVLIHGPVLNGLGAFLAPAGEREGEAVVLEGTQVLITQGVNQGIALLKEGRVKRMYLVLHLLPQEQQLFAIQKEKNWNAWALIEDSTGSFWPRSTTTPSPWPKPALRSPIFSETGSKRRFYWPRGSTPEEVYGPISEWGTPWASNLCRFPTFRPTPERIGGNILRGSKTSRRKAQNWDTT